MREFDWNDLRFFLEVARTGTLSGAARVLGTDHATVSRRIDALERALQQLLFARSPTGCSLTPRGKELLPTAEQMESLASQSAQAVGAHPTVLSGVVRLSAPDGFGNFFLAPLLDRFGTAHPRLRLQMVIVQQIQATSQREGDVIVTLSPPVRGHFVTEKLTDYGLGLYAGTHYFEKHAAVSGPDDLRQHRLIGYVDDLIFARELDYLGEVLPAIRAQIQSTSLWSQIAVVRRGGGIGLLPHYIAGQFDDLVPLLRDRIQLQRTYWMNVPAEDSGIARVAALRDFVRGVVSESGAAAWK